MPQRKRRIMRAFKINEISAVDSPAQEGARAVIMKRGDEDREHDLEKRVWLTTDVDGHAHLVDDRDYDGAERDGGDTSWSVSNSDEENRGHSHPWIQDIDGSVTIGASEGHTHEVLETTIKMEDSMPKAVDNTKDGKDEGAEALKAATDRNVELETELAEAKARAEMTDAEKAHLETLDPQLDDDARKAFLAAKSGERAEIVAKAAKAAEDAKGVAYTADDGTEYTKADDPRLVSQAKRNDELARDLGKAKKRHEEQDLRKRAEEDLKHLPGAVEIRMALLKAAESIEDDDERKAALEALKAQSEQLGKAFKTLGSRQAGGEIPVGESADSPQGQLDELAKRYAKDNEVSEAAGYDAILQTKEGADLYGQVTGDSEYVN